jgi:rRNA maturation RNase YbeY
MIKFNNLDRTFYFPAKKRLKAFIEKLFLQEGRRPGNVQYVFCSDEYLLTVNRQFLQHDFYTDIITFDLGGGEMVDAEIYISIDRVKENALEFGESFPVEMMRVIFHGALHLCGYGDKTKSEITLMRERESFYLRLFEKENPRK